MNLRNFFSSFPPPEYIDVPYIGIVFSDHSIRMLVLDKKSHRPTFFSEISLPSGIIEMGKVKDEEALSKILAEKSSSFDTPFVYFSIPDESSYVFTAKVPVLGSGDVRESVEFILEENVPLPLADISFDFVAERLDDSPGGHTAKVLVVAASTSLIESYVNALRKAGFEPILCLNESQATAYAVVPKGSTGVHIIIHVHKDSAGIYIVQGGLAEFSSVVSLRDASGVDLAARSIKSELERAIDYWSSRAEKKADDKSFMHCYLCGEYENIKDLLARISEIGNINPVSANVWVNAFSLGSYIPELPFEDSLRFAGAVGLFLDK